MDKLHDYQGFTGRLHELRDNFSNRYSNWKEDHPESFIEMMKTKVKEQIDDNQTDYANQDYSHVYRKKSRTELIRVSAAVMGIEFSYAAETAFVSPTLLKIGVDHQHMTLVWALSPLVGFFLTPILGSLSDRCKLNMGRRRPFIILLSIGVFLGLLLVPNGEALGYALGDYDVYRQEEYNRTMLPHRTTASNSTITSNDKEKASHPWGIFFTILGTVLLDFDADACQSPSRAYLLDVTLPEDNAKGLSTFTIMAGLGGFMGYSLGGINWDDTAIGIMLGGHVRAVFTLITIIFIICVSATITSFREVPLWVLEAKGDSLKTANISPTEAETQFLNQDSNNYGTIPNKDDESIATVNGDELPQIPIESGEASVSLSDYLMSIVMMPKSMQMVCLTNLFCWMAHVCYSLYFTDFVGEAVFGGDPRSPYGSRSQNLYEEGVRFGCWGMAMYSLSCSCYSLIIEKLIKRFGAKHVYVGGLLFYCTGMTLMALTRAKASVIIFSWGAGVMYSTLFTMPYLLIAHYHTKQVFEVSATGEELIGTQIRGLGTDVAIVSSMVFMAQFILSVCMGTIVSISGTTTAVVSVASFLSFCAALTATQIMYLDL